MRLLPDALRDPTCAGGGDAEGRAARSNSRCTIRRGFACAGRFDEPSRSPARSRHMSPGHLSSSNAGFVVRAVAVFGATRRPVELDPTSVAGRCSRVRAIRRILSGGAWSAYTPKPAGRRKRTTELRSRPLARIVRPMPRRHGEAERARGRDTSASAAVSMEWRSGGSTDVVLRRGDGRVHRSGSRDYSGVNVCAGTL